MLPNSNGLTCRFCGRTHAPVDLRPGRRALCTDCGLTLVRRSHLGPDASAAFALTGLVLAVPAVLLPFAHVHKFGAQQTTLVFDGAIALWQDGLPLLAGWVALCGTLAPALLLLALAGAQSARNRSAPGRWHTLFQRLGHALEAWAMPEVHVLAVLVSFIRIESLADVQVGPGFWCYAGMAVALVLAWRNHLLEPAPARRAAEAVA